MLHYKPCENIQSACWPGYLLADWIVLELIWNGTNRDHLLWSFSVHNWERLLCSHLHKCIKRENKPQFNLNGLNTAGVKTPQGWLEAVLSVWRQAASQRATFWSKRLRVLTGQLLGSVSMLTHYWQLVYDGKITAFLHSHKEVWLSHQRDFV